jgi:hypothetical protein
MRTNFRGGHRDSDPFVDELSRLVSEAVAYNGGQEKFTLPSKEEDLIELLTQSDLRAANDAYLLSREVLRPYLPNLKPIAPRSTTLIVISPATHMKRFAEIHVSYAEVEQNPGDQPVRLLLMDEPLERRSPDVGWPNRPSWLSLFDGFNDVEVSTWGDGGFSVIAELLGYYDQEVSHREWRDFLGIPI